jgi:hypothetical protein
MYWPCYYPCPVVYLVQYYMYQYYPCPVVYPVQWYM